MTERPILFSAPMVRAILAGTKTQTRRVVKGAPDDWAPLQPQAFWPTVVRRGMEEPGAESYGAGNEDGDCWVTCPYGQPGDRLWVRETFYAWGRWETRYSAKKGRDEWHFVDMTLESGKAYEYPASGGQPQPMGGKRHRGGTTPTWWKRPAIHMPRAASRITLEITGVRVERLQDISEADALAEGIVQLKDGGYGLPAGEHYHAADPRQSYLSLWEAINGPGSVEANPWVWCVEFARAA